MNINFNYLEINNFRSIKEGRIDIKEGKHLILGVTDVMSSQSNGAGKSSIFESLVWCIYKKDIRSSDPSFNKMGDCRVAVGFNIGDDQYEITRYHKDSKEKNNVYIKLNGADISNRLPSLTDSEIAKIIPINYDVFVSTIIVLQGFPVNISKFTPTARKLLIENAIGFSLWDRLKKFFNGFVTDFNNEVDGVNTQIADFTNNLTRINTEHSVLTSKNSEDANMYQNEFDNKNNDVSSAKIELDTIIQNLETFNMSPIEIYMDSRLELNKIESEMNNMNKMLQNRSCPTCSRPYPEENFKEYENKLTNLNRFHKKSKLMCDESEAVKDQFNLLTQQKNIAENKISMLGSELAGIQSKLNELSSNTNDTRLKKLVEESEQVSKNLNLLNEKLGDISKKREYMEYINSLLLPSSDFRSEILSVYVEYINEIMSGITSSIFSDIGVKLVIDNKKNGIDIKLTRGGKLFDYKSLSGGETRRMDVIIMLAFQSFLIDMSGVKCNLMVLDEIFDGLDGCGIDSVLDTVYNLFDNSHSLYVITHNDAIKSRFNSIIKVIKSNGSSQIVA